MKEETRKIYTCEFCGKYYKRKHFAEKHEKYCRKNPNNKHICLQQCAHLKKSTWVEEGEYYDQKCTTFTCNEHFEEMHTYVAERRNLESCLAKRMPLKCDDYVDENQVWTDKERKELGMGIDDDLPF